MEKLNPSFKLNLVVGLILFALTVLGHFFADSLILASLMWPAFGFTSIFYYKYQKKVLIGIILGVFLAQMFNELVLEQNTTYIDVIMRVSFTLTTLIEAYLFTVVFRFLTNKHKKDDSKIILSTLFVTSGIIATFIGGLFSTLVLELLFEGTLDYWYFSSRWMLGDFSGFIIFAPLVLGILNSKDKFYIIKLGQLFYHVCFLIFILILFAETIPGLNYDDIGYILVVWYVIGALVFKYNFILFNNILLLIVYQFIYIRFTLVGFDIDKISSVLLSLNLLVIIVSNLALLIVYFIEKMTLQKIDISKKNKELSTLIDSTYKLIDVSGSLLSKGKTIDEEYLKAIFSIAKVIFTNFDGASCFITDNGYVKFIDSLSYDIDALNKLRIKTSSFNWNVSKTIVNRFTEESLKSTLKENYEAYRKQVPLIHNSINVYFKLSNDNIGGLSFDLYKDKNQFFTNEDIKLYDSFYTLMNSFYENARLHTERDQFKSHIVLSLVKMLGIFDEYTYDHSTDVANISKEIAKRVGLNQEKQYEVYWAGIIHDIGKIGVDNRIINKSSSLTKEEYEQVKTHPLLAYNILKDNDDLTRIANFVKHHHEKYDGTGYPDGLKGNRIPLESQILHVADAVSSMSTIRTYSSKKSIYEIKEELKIFSGSQFNPELADIMIQMIDEGYLNDRY